MQPPKHVSDAVRRLNPDIYGPGPRLDPDPPSGVDQCTRTLDPGPTTQEGGTKGDTRRTRFRVTLVAWTQNELDPDNLGAALKHVQDAVAQYLGVDDGDRRRVVWQYGNVPTRGRKGVLVQIEEEPI